VFIHTVPKNTISCRCCSYLAWLDSKRDGRRGVGRGINSWSGSILLFTFHVFCLAFVCFVYIEYNGTLQLQYHWLFFCWYRMNNMFGVNKQMFLWYDIWKEKLVREQICLLGSRDAWEKLHPPFLFCVMMGSILKTKEIVGDLVLQCTSLVPYSTVLSREQIFSDKKILVDKTLDIWFVIVVELVCLERIRVPRHITQVYIIVGKM